MKPEPLDQNVIMLALNAMVEAAEAIDVAATFAIVDSSGMKMGYLKMLGSFLASEQYAFNKAYTAASFFVTTAKFSEMLDSMESQIRSGLLDHPQVTRLPGGVPILKAGLIVGGLGVSGGTGDQDVTIAEVGLAAIANYLA